VPGSGARVGLSVDNTKARAPGPAAQAIHNAHRLCHLEDVNGGARAGHRAIAAEARHQLRNRGAGEDKKFCAAFGETPEGSSLSKPQRVTSPEKLTQALTSREGGVARGRHAHRSGRPRPVDAEHLFDGTIPNCGPP
jgi:hypothetical protein